MTIGKNLPDIHTNFSNKTATEHIDNDGKEDEDGTDTGDQRGSAIAEVSQEKAAEEWLYLYESWKDC